MHNEFLAGLLNQMTFNEKTAQLTQLAKPFFKGSHDQGEITGPLEELKLSDELIENAGSVLGAYGAREIKDIQKRHLKDNRLGIPLLFMADVIHGYKTIFPVPLAMGCSWNLDLAEKSMEMAAREAAVSGLHVTFAPMVDLVRDPRWGRVMESTGEDSYLNSRFAEAQVRGLQGTDLTAHTERLASCVKHFAAYGAAEGGRDYNTVDMSERQLRESYLPAYKAALDAGSELVMTAFNIIDGVPATGNKSLMRNLLRKEWGFNGVLISDWGAVKELIPHGVAADTSEAAEKALTAGVDIEMMTTTYSDHLKQLVEKEKLDEQLIDEAVMRVLELKQKLGLFENPYRGADEAREKAEILSEENRKVAQDLAAESCVLLKNDGMLPLKLNQRVALIGPFAENNDILGPWSFVGSKTDAITLKNGIEKKLKESNLVVEEGCGIDAGLNEKLDAALKAAEEADVIILALGESSEMSGEAGSRANIKLPSIQLELASRIHQLNKPVVTVLFNGRPLDLDGVIDKANAVLEAWYPGTEGGAAIADLLFGEANPSGKLSMSFPQSVGQIPVYYNHFNTGRPKDAPDAQVRYVSQYLDTPNEALMPFGYGLSYTNYMYENMILSQQQIKTDEVLTAAITVVNTGSYAGAETVQLYIRDKVAETVRPLKELKGFQKIWLEPGESKQVEFIISEDQLRYHHSNLVYKSDPGKFIVFIGPNSRDVTEQTFELIN